MLTLAALASKCILDKNVQIENIPIGAQNEIFMCKVRAQAEEGESIEKTLYHDNHSYIVTISPDTTFSTKKRKASRLYCDGELVKRILWLNVVGDILNPEDKCARLIHEEFKDGNLHGYYKYSKLDHVKQYTSECGHYNEGLREGKWKTFNGGIKNVQYYVAGKKHGEFLKYRHDGSLMQKGQYENDQRVGTWETYMTSGETFLTVYENDTLVTEGILDKILGWIEYCFS